MPVMVQVTEVGVPVPTVTVPEVKLFPPLVWEAEYRPKVVFRSLGGTLGQRVSGVRAYRSRGPAAKNRAMAAASRPRTIGRCRSARR